MKDINLRDYQKECIETIQSQPPGAYLVQMATGLGKTVTFANIQRKGKMLILSHREELVRQPLKYFDCLTGVEMAGEHATPMDEVVSASVQTMAHRLERFAPDEFDIVVVDEAHHSSASTYRRILNYFHPRLTLGFTATPNRSDNVRMNDIYQDIIFQRDLKWGIKNGYLSDIFCRRVNIGYDLRSVHTRGGDYAPGELEKAMDGTADAIAETYRTMAAGATLIFAVSVNQAQEIAKRIPGAAVVTGETKDRADIIKAFTDGQIPCIVNCMVFTEGTDIPRVETVIVARPTQSDSLYTQMVGRGLRLYPGKERLNLIDCVGVSGRASLCTAPSLLGIDLKDVPERRLSEMDGMLFELPEKVERAADCPESWIKNVQIVDLWAQEQKYNTHGVNFFKMPNGSMVCSLMDREKIVIPCQDELGRVNFNGRLMPMQSALDFAYIKLTTNYKEQEYIWNLEKAKCWGKAPASDKQLQLIQRRCKGFDPAGLTKLQASQILNRVMNGGRRSA
ncbi:DEAD/DEAH box helicase [Caproiciproducens sp. AGMB10547]|uniref:DEAD/DEAH box helicase n=1 Tax=Caproiciproducens faecalis TaxID=2820301 RepID=A0ABS7DRS9_9FIRM|nr:DEAD/DEAH box helicase [Caproiciproducens faecalis]MBW7573893.1 DEAD/DEAH box helicase [Caproiciproducens faecalis]